MGGKWVATWGGADVAKSDEPNVKIVRKDGRGYLCRWKDPDTRKWRERSLASEGVKSRVAAERWAEAMRNELARSHVPTARGGRALWEKQIHPERIRELTPSRSARWPIEQRTDLKRFLAFLAREGIHTGGQLRDAHLIAFRAEVLAEELSADRKNSVLSATRALINWALDRGYTAVSERAVRKQLATIKRDSRLPRTLTPAEIEHLFAVATRLDEQHVITLGLLTGARPGEVARIQGAHVNAERGWVEIWGQKTRMERAAPWHDSPALKELIERLQAREGKGYLCGATPTGKPRGIPQRKREMLVAAANIEGYSMNALRRTCISAVTFGGQYGEGVITARFGNSEDVRRIHYLSPDYDAAARGDTVEEWLGAKDAIWQAVRSIG